MQEHTVKRPSGMFGFTLVWIGQIVSVLASAMSQFGLTIWMFQKTESATALGLMQVFFITPFLLISPIAGVMVDRHNRKMMMMVSDIVAGIATILILIFQWQGILEFWHLYFASVIYGLGMAFQWPAYSAAITTMVPKEQYGRANGMMSLIEAGPGVVAPLLAGALLPLIGLTGILLFDVVTFLFAVGVLMFVHVPQPPRTKEGAQGQGSVWKEAAYGFKYIFARPSLLGLQLIFFVGNLFSGIGFTLLAPMVLSRTANDSLMLGSVQTAGAIGGVIGGVLMSAWGGFKRRVNGVLLGWMISGLGMSIVGLVGGLPIWITGIIIAALVGPLDQRFQPSHLASQGCPGCAGTRLLCTPLDRLVHQPHFAHHRWYTGRLRRRTANAHDQRALRNLWLDRRHRSRRGHGVDHFVLWFSHRVCWACWIFHPRHSQCRGDAARS
jgi:MFS transporter, DHA3 family, macrolide efflux protein